MTTRTKVIIAVVVAAAGVALYMRARRDRDGKVSFTQFSEKDCECFEVFYGADAKPLRSEPRPRSVCEAEDPDLFASCP